MKNIIVAGGETFTDIDVFACTIAYAELLRLEGNNAEAVIPGVLNNSITPTIKGWNIPFSKTPPWKEYSSVIVDISELSYIAKCASLETVIEIYDHRYGFKDFWDKKLGKDSHIEYVGSCTTLIWEEFKKRGFADKISKTSAALLLIGTASNTLNFGAQVTHQRDLDAFDELQQHVSLPENWKETYFSEQSESVLKDPVASIKMDTKVMTIPGLQFPVVMGQMELWNAGEFLTNHISEIKKALESFNESHWFMSLPSISENKNYLYTENPEVKLLLEKIIEAKFEGYVGSTDKLWLRKEVRKKLFEMNV